MVIKNLEELLSHGNVEARKDLVDIVEHALNAVDPEMILPEHVKLKDDRTLIVRNREYDLSEIENIYVLGAGKGSYTLSKALLSILGKIVEDGVVVEKGNRDRKIESIKVLGAGHPIPDETGLKACEEVVELAEGAEEDDLVFVCITGGASALLPAPVKGVSLADLVRVTDLLLKSGAPIEEVNAVRKHISKIKGGRLAKRIHPARFVNLIVVDEVAGDPWGPTVPDETTFLDAVEALEKHDLLRKTPDSIKEHLNRGLEGSESETLDSDRFENLSFQNVILADAEDVSEAAKEKAEALGYDSVILSTMLEGESKEAGVFLAGVAKEALKNERPVSPPCAIISGGETTVSIDGDSGEGGPNQELVLGLSLKIEDNSEISAISIGTDGTDGPTDIAGGIVDGYTLERADKRGIDVFGNLISHNSSYVLRDLGDAVYTGPTKTNLMDLRIVIVDK